MQYNDGIKSIFQAIPARLVGGCVRDSLLGITPKDYDFATPLHYDEVTRVFESKGYHVIPTGVQHGTVTVVIDSEPYEITTLRKDVETDGRHAVVKFVSDWSEDAERRDFTFNALYMDENQKVHDYFGGVEDLNNNRIRFVGDAEKRIQEDALRILRYYRFACRFNIYNQDDSAVSAIKNNAHMVANLSAERIFAEISKIFSYKSQAFAMEEMSKNGLDKIVFGPSGLNGWYDYTSEIEPNYLYSLSLIADRPEYMRRFKASSEDIAFIERVLDETEISSDVHSIRTLLFNKYSPDMIQAKALLNGLAPLDVNYETPVLPIRGQDFLDMGISGKAIGDKMKEATRKWIASDFSLSREQLLNKNSMELKI